MPAMHAGINGVLSSVHHQFRAMPVQEPACALGVSVLLSSSASTKHAQRVVGGVVAEGAAFAVARAQAAAGVVDGADVAAVVGAKIVHCPHACGAGCSAWQSGCASAESSMFKRALFPGQSASPARALPVPHC